MFLINAKTSGKVCSGRITELDIRGGAAITGPNGAGKTTTLQLLPLFFGHSPSQIAPVGENREPMLRFVLPYPESAVVYEYQRGDGLDDVCLVVLRRHTQTDAPEYRFFASAFRKEFFVAKDSDGDGEVFLDDVTSAEVATKLGCSPSAKHTAAHYRQVILNNIGVGKDADARRVEARKFSFSSKRLPHLDRLVAAVVKEHINFADFTEVAANIVTERIGGLNANGAGKSPQLRQSKEQIERWLRDRDGAERALKLKPLVEGLRDALGRNQQQEILLGQKRSDVQRLRRINQQIVDQANAALKALTELKNRETEQADAELDKHNGLIAAATQSVREASNLYQDLKNQKDYLEDNDAPAWAKKQQQLPGMKASRDTQSELIGELQKAASGILQTYERSISNAKSTAALTTVKMLEGKNTPNNLYDKEIALLSEQETTALNTLNDKNEAELADLQAKLERQIAAVSEAEMCLARPRVAPEIEERWRHAAVVLSDHQQEIIVAQGALSQYTNNRNAAQNKRDDLERQVEQQKQRLREAEQALNQAQARVQPAAGSLHAALLASPDDQWRAHLARVIDPALLVRTDLYGHLVDEGSSLYGWAINLDAIEAPEWTHREMLDNMLAMCEQQESTARTRLVELDAAFNDAEEARLEAIEAFNQHDARLNVLNGKTERFKKHESACKADMVKAMAAAETLAGQEHDAAKQKLAAERKSLNTRKTEMAKEVAAEKETFNAARKTAQTRRDTKLNEIDANVTTFQRQQSTLIKEMELARDRELQEKGVDTDKLNRLNTQLNMLTGEIKEINDHADLVLSWDRWINTHGPSRLVDADTALERAKKALTTAQTNQSDLQKAHAKRLLDLAKQEKTHNGAISKANFELNILNEADRLLADFAMSGASTLTSDAFASELLAECQLAFEAFNDIQRDIRLKVQRLERELCEKESSTREFVVGVLNEVDQDRSDVARATRMVRLYDRIPREVVVNVNTSLSTILENISEYRKTLLSFESEVRRFNQSLQEGLKRVSRSFERFSDFTANVVTDFDKIDFIGKLKLLDDVVLEHRAQHHSSYSMHVPPVHIAEALRTFMTALASGTMEINLGQHITLSGSVTDDGNFKTFHSESQLEQISSNGLTAIALIMLLSGLINVIRGSEPIHIPWATDEIGRFDPGNFQRLMQMLQHNLIDVVTASPSLTPAAYEHFAKRYVFQPQGVIAEYRPRARAQALPSFVGVAS
ncbi:ATP-binding protein [Rhodoferax fermentans]|uniref:ATP-binding protein n=1 Tax=Rhodoferax fermentans TaxID=28066 RepID=A0A1T1AMS3_RHOFE|nr:ATP-binding protein [Rhodoferax fermentans]OOV05354.1 hypothetical protein RF819_00290 [Rhodoferax fermentans]